MSLENNAKQILQNFEETSSKDIIDVLDQIQNQFQSTITKDYLQGKLKSISDIDNEEERKTLCKYLKPYFNWYLQKS
ncbi:MAG TPA: hypothetical protein VMW55_08855 [Nitrosopumilaceae archaeon]|nr:hypothetical protein [Nitrosopumilaceae archaeon]